MDVNAIASLATNLSNVETTNAIQVAVLKKAIDAQAEGAMALIQALPQAGAYNNPPNLGNGIDVFA